MREKNAIVHAFESRTDLGSESGDGLPKVLLCESRYRGDGMGISWMFVAIEKRLLSSKI